MTFHPVFSEFLSTFVSHRVRFLVVGGHALAVHGRPRYTDDLDVWVDPTQANAKRVVAALKALGYDGDALHADEFSTLDRMTHLGTPPLRIDIMTSVSGVPFAEAWKTRVRAQIEGRAVCFLRRDALTRPFSGADQAKRGARAQRLNGSTAQRLNSTPHIQPRVPAWQRAPRHSSFARPSRPRPWADQILAARVSETDCWALVLLIASC